MIRTSQRLYLLLLLLFTGSLLVPSACLAATVSCTATMSGGVTFGTADFTNNSVSTSNPTLSYTCTNPGKKTKYANVCFNIDTGVQSSTIDSRAMTDGAGHSLIFQLYKDPRSPPSNPLGSITLGGSDTPLEVTLSVPGKGSVSGSATLYGHLLPGQTTLPAALPAGNYKDAFIGSQTSITLKSNKNKVPPTCGKKAAGTFPFTATATAINMTGSNAINVTCANGTPYYVGLSPSNGNTAGAGLMTGTGSNVDKVPYQLRSATGFGGASWGNTATSAAVGDGVAGNGNGTSQPITVYATGHSANYRPDTYSDTVTINANF